MTRNDGAVLLFIVLLFGAVWYGVQATIQVPVGSVGDDWLKRYLGDAFSCCSR